MTDTERAKKQTPVLVVEGRDDTAAVRRALEIETIETHGFGISDATWDLLAEADRKCGLIIFTDPDHAGESIRQRLTERFPHAGQAYLDREDARAGADIGIENASPAAIRRALARVHVQTATTAPVFSRQDLFRAGLDGAAGAKEARHRVGRCLGIGYGNAEAFVRKLNRYGITREEFNEAVYETDDRQTDDQ